MTTMKFDKKCLRDNNWRDDYNFTLIFHEFNQINTEFDEAAKHLIVYPVVYDENPLFSNDTSYPFEKRKTTLMHNSLGGIKVQLT